MPRRKPKPEKIVQENIKSTLDQILMDEGLDSDTIQPSDLPRLKPPTSWTLQLQNLMLETTLES